MADLGKVIQAASHMKVLLKGKSEVERLFAEFDALRSSDGDADPVKVKKLRAELAATLAALSFSMNPEGYREVLMELIKLGHIRIAIEERGPAL